LSRRLFQCASLAGAKSIGFAGGRLQAGCQADFFTIELNDASISGSTADDLMAQVIFSLARTAIKDVFVGGKQIVAAGRHYKQDEIVHEFNALQDRLWR